MPAQARKLAEGLVAGTDVFRRRARGRLRRGRAAAGTLDRGYGPRSRRPAEPAAVAAARGSGSWSSWPAPGRSPPRSAASRLLAPYFGRSTIVWANIIGLILVYLSLGYWLGGKLADRRPEPRLLGLIVLVAALAIVATPFIARPILDLAVEGLDAAVGRCGGRLVLRHARALRDPGRAARNGLAVRDQARDRRRRRGRDGRRAASTRSRPSGHPRDVSPALVDHPAHRDAADDARLGRAPRLRRRAPARPPVAGRGRRGRRAPRDPGRHGEGDGGAALRGRSRPTSTSRCVERATGRGCSS